jgi:hypothetical protein
MKQRTGHLVSESGIYLVIHSQHRLPHSVTICKGETFPRCSKCNELVVFELLQAAECAFSYEPIHVFELQPVDENTETATAGGSDT